MHRNVANQVVHSDLNCMSVLDFAVNNLGVEDIIVCGHYKCGGVQAALKDIKSTSPVFHWIRHIKDVAKHYKSE